MYICLPEVYVIRDGHVTVVQTCSLPISPALGAVGALGVVVAMNQAVREGWDEGRLQREIDRIRTARPTAVNLAWGVDQVRSAIPQGVAAVLSLARGVVTDRKSTRLNSSHVAISYAVFCLKKKKNSYVGRALSGAA